MKNQKDNFEILTREWLLKAQDDERSAEVLLKEEGSPNTVCFLSQQMAEKYLKGYLVSKEREFPKIHELDKLARLCEEIDPDFAEIREEARFLTTFYIITRYPGDYPQFSFKDAEESFKKVVKIKDFVLDRIEF